MAQGVYVKGQGVVEFPDEIDKETILQALRRKFMSGAKSAVGAGEAALAVGSSAISEPVSGLAGLVGAAIPGEQGQGARYVQAVGDALSYEPSTDKGVEYMRSIANILQPVGEVIQGASQNLGDKAYSATGSPLAGAIGYSLPTAMLEGLGLKGLNIARKPVGGADLYSARMGAGAVDADKWSYISNKYNSRKPEKTIKTNSGEIRFFDASDADGTFKDAAYYDKDGNVIGTLFSGPDTDGKWVGSVEVRPDMRRQGIATALYNEMENFSGAKMKPAEKNSADAQAFWKSRSPEQLNPKSISEKYKQSGVESSITERPNEITLQKVIVPKEARGAGVGSRFMNDLIQYADEQGKTVSLTPSADFGGNKARLTEFYKRFGFVENKGKNKDYEISEAMYRPKK